MKRYVLKLNDSSYVKNINWIIVIVPSITTGSFEDALIVDDDYLNEVTGHNGYDKTLTKKDLIKIHYPEMQFLPVKIVLDIERCD
ncbi:hypothetical protein ACPA0F_18685 [Solibacillus silvestris]